MRSGKAGRGGGETNLARLSEGGREHQNERLDLSNSSTNSIAQIMEEIHSYDVHNTVDGCSTRLERFQLFSSVLSVLDLSPRW